MTDDLVKRLRELDTWVETAHTPIEAADRIEALNVENERLRTALFAWIDMMNDPSTKLRRKVVEFYSIAIAALK